MKLSLAVQGAEGIEAAAEAYAAGIERATKLVAAALEDRAGLLLTVPPTSPERHALRRAREHLLEAAASMKIIAEHGEDEEVSDDS